MDAELAKRLPELIALQQGEWANKGFLKKHPELRAQFDGALAREVSSEGLPSSDQVAAVYSIVGLRVASRMAKAPSTYEAAVSKVARCLWQMDPLPEAPGPFLRTFGLYPPRESSSLTERVGHDIATEVAKGYRARLLLASICSDSLDREALRRIGASTSTQDAEEDETHQVEMA